MTKMSLYDLLLNVFPTLSPPTHFHCFFFPFATTPEAVPLSIVWMLIRMPVVSKIGTGSERGFPNKKTILKFSFSPQECTLVLKIQVRKNSEGFSFTLRIRRIEYRTIDSSNHRAPPPLSRSRINRFGHKTRGSVRTCTKKRQVPDKKYRSFSYLSWASMHGWP